MATSTLEFLILAKDQASAAFEKVGGAVEKSASKVDKLKSVVPIASAAAGAALVGMATAGVDSAMKLQDTTAAAGVVFGGSMDKIIAQADGAAKTLGMNKQQVIDAANTFGTYGKAAGLSGDALAGFSTKMTGLAGDMASFKGTSPEQAIEAIGAALRGETEPIRAYGVLLDDASMRNEALAMGLTKTTTQVLTPQQKVLAAQSLILKQTSDAQGDFARTADSAANSQKAMQAEATNASTKFGTMLLPAFTAVTQAGTKILSWLSDTPGAMQGVSIALGVMALAWVGMTVAASPWLLIGAAIAAVIAGVILAVKNWGAISSWFSGVWNGALNAVKGWFSGAADWISDKWNGLIGWFKKVPGYIGDAIKGVTDFITAPFRQAFNALASLWNRSIGGLSFTVPDWVPGIGGKGITLPNLPMLATGGYIQQGGLAIVGERGPEIVNLPTGSKVNANGSMLRLHPDDIAALASAVLSGAAVMSSATLAGAQRSADNSRTIQARVH